MNIRRFGYIRSFVSVSLDCLFPSLCLACRTKLKSEKEKKFFLCEKCQSKISINEHIYCSECRNRIPIGPISPISLISPISPTSPVRSHCHENAPPLLAATNYENPVIRKLIHTLKYQHITTTLIPITELFIKPYLEKIYGHLSLANSHCVLVPVPLHKSKERKRGFNQSELIAQKFAERLKEISPISPIGPIRLITRARNTKTQTEMKDQKSRAENVKNCFTLNQNSKLDIQNSHIVLVDDVCTSGSTLKEATRALRANGFRNITAFVLAKT